MSANCANISVYLNRNYNCWDKCTGIASSIFYNSIKEGGDLVAGQSAIAGDLTNLTTGYWYFPQICRQHALLSFNGSCPTQKETKAVFTSERTVVSRLVIETESTWCRLTHYL